ncbi:MAG: 2-oxoglutarate and iron-dependent oxygenase domain-containing protein, partial [Pseudomonadota bacterium]
MSSSVPTLSLTDFTGSDPARRAAFCEQLLAGLKRYGFIILVDHAIAPAALEHAYALSARFFALPDAVKREYAKGPRGYTPFRTETAVGQKAADLKEFWQIGPERDGEAPRGLTEPPNVWPPEPADFRSSLLSLYRGLQETGRLL